MADYSNNTPHSSANYTSPGIELRTFIANNFHDKSEFIPQSYTELNTELHKVYNQRQTHLFIHTKY